jgi:hypothetical protein
VAADAKDQGSRRYDQSWDRLVKRIRDLSHFLAFTSSGVLVFALYLVVPALITARAVFPTDWAGMLIAFASLAIGELIIYSILVRTTRRRAITAPVKERRAFVRRVADFNIEISSAAIGNRVRARAINASAGGLAVLVEPDEWEGDRPIKLHVPGSVDAVEAEQLDLVRVNVEGRPQSLIRLRLSANGHNGHSAASGTMALAADRGWPYGGTLGAPTNGHISSRVKVNSVQSGVRSVLALCAHGILRIGRLLPLPLWVVLGVQSAASVSMRNTVFQDEATYLFAGRQIVHHMLGGPAPTEWVGDFLAGTTLYPTIGGAIDLVGGLEATRLFSLFWMLCATVSVFVVARGLYDRSSALLAAALFGEQGSVLFIGHFATFDAMAVGLLALASAVAASVGAARRPWLAPLVAVLLLIASAATYVSVLYIPTVLALLCWRAFRVHGWRQALLRTVLACAVLAVAGAWAVNNYPGGVGAFNSAIARRIAADPASTTVLVQLTVYLGGFVIALAAVGLLLSRRSYLPLGLVLLGSSLAAPAYHILDGEFTSLQKHVAYGALFAAPLAGNAVTRLAGHRRIIGVVLCLMFFTSGYEADRRLDNWWPNSSDAIAALQSQIRPGDRILAEEHEVLEFYLTNYEADLGHLSWSQTYDFQYTDSAGRFYDGIPAYKAAIADGYFDLVVLRYGPTATLDHEIDGGLRDGTRYELVAKIPYDTAFGPSAYWIWRKRSVVESTVPIARAPAGQLLAIHNERHTVHGGRTQACDQAGNTNGAEQPGCEIVSSEWLPHARVTYTLSYPDGTTQTFVDTADSRGHSLHAFAVHYRAPLGAVHDQVSTIVRIHVTARSQDGRRTTSSSTRFAVMH